jgi:hypothetical protein
MSAQAYRGEETCGRSPAGGLEPIGAYRLGVSGEVLGNRLDQENFCYWGRKGGKW